MKRLTKQRKTILALLHESNHPLSMEELHQEALKSIPRLSLSTLYRNLKSLIEEKRVQAIKVSSSSVRYEIANSRHMHHFHCRECDRLYNIPLCPSGLEAMTPPGFKVRSHEIVLVGSCQECIAI